jgi:hypothetical protein
MEVDTMPRRTALVILLAVLSVGLSSAWAFVVTDPATTAKNAVTAVLKSRVLDTLTEQRRRFYRMARRLSVSTNLDKYLVDDVPRWRAYRFQDVHLYANPYSEALNYGDPEGTAYAAVTRKRALAGPEVAELAGVHAAARSAILAELATLDLADSTNIAWTDQNGQLRANGKSQMRVIDALERDVLDPSPTQSATAILDKISAATLIGIRQKQSRLHFLTGIVEHLLVDNKRARDTEAAVLNMQLGRLRGSGDEGSKAFLAGVGNDLRTWRQP